MKKRVLSMILTFCLVLTLLPTMAAATDPAGSISIGSSIGTLTTGYYVAASDASAPSNSAQPPVGVRVVDKVADETAAGANYLYYDAETAVLTVHGAVALESTSAGIAVSGAATLNTGTRGTDSLSFTGSAGSPVTIGDKAVLTLTGGGALTLSSSGGSTVSDTGSLTTNGYTGDVSISQTGGACTIDGLASVNLTTTGSLTISGGNSAPAINGSDVTLSGGSVALSGGYMLFSGYGKTLSITSAASLNLGSSIQPPMIAGNLALASDGDITVKYSGSNCAVTGSLTVTKAKNVTISSSANAPLVGGSTVIAADGDVSITSTGTGSGFVASGPLTVSKSNSTTISNNSGNPTIKGSPVTVSATNDITIANYGSGAAFVGNIVPTLTSANGTVTTVSQGLTTVKAQDGTTTTFVDVQKTGLDFSTAEKVPTAETSYHTGSGTIVFTPAVKDADGVVTVPAKLTMTNATMNAPINLTGLDAVIIDVEGTNSVVTSYGNIPSIGTKDVTITGSGTLTASGSNPQDGCAAGIFAKAGKPESGTDAAQFENKIGNRLHAIVKVETITVSESSTGGVSSYADTVYGNVTINSRYFVADDITVVRGATLTTEAETENTSGGYLEVDGKISNQGAIVNNGAIGWELDGMGSSDIAALNLSGSGTVYIDSDDSYNQYTNDGVRTGSTYRHCLNFTLPSDGTEGAAQTGGWSSTASVSQNGYAWDAKTNTLTIGNLSVRVWDTRALVLPDGATLVLQNGTKNSLSCSGNSNWYSIALSSASTNTDHTADKGLTIRGGGTLYASPSEAVDNDSGTGGNSLGIYSDGPISICSGMITTSGVSSASGNTAGICSGYGAVTISGGTVSTNGGSGSDADSGHGAAAISAATDVTITGGTVSANVTSGGNHSYTIDASLQGTEDNYDLGIFAQTGSFLMSGGTLNAIANTAAIAAAAKVTIGSSLTISVPSSYSVGAIPAQTGYQTLLDGDGNAAAEVKIYPTPVEPTTTTTTTTNADGSTTKTTTDITSGTVTKVTTGTDGSKTTVETKKDGTTTIRATVPSGGGSVTIPTTTPPTNTTVAVLTKADGTKVKLHTKAASDGTLSVTIPESGSIELVDNARTFEDVPDSHWAKSDIDLVAALGLMNGTDTNDFSPDDPMSRAMVWTVLCRMNVPDAKDSTTDPWYQNALDWAVASNISDGTNPNENVTREQLVTLLWRAAGSPEVDADLSSFPDAASVSDWALGAVKWAVKNGILEGSNGSLLPQDSASRAEVAAMLERYLTK